MSPPGPNTWTLNIQPLGRFHPHRHFLLARSTLPQQCGSFATYRRLSCARRHRFGVLHALKRGLHDGSVRALLNGRVHPELNAELNAMSDDEFAAIIGAGTASAGGRSRRRARGRSRTCPK